MVTNFSLDPEISHYSVILIYFSRRLMQIKYHSSQRMNIKGVKILGQFTLKMESYPFVVVFFFVVVVIFTVLTITYFICVMT